MDKKYMGRIENFKKVLKLKKAYEFIGDSYEKHGRTARNHVSIRYKDKEYKVSIYTATNNNINFDPCTVTICIIGIRVDKYTRSRYYLRGGIKDIDSDIESQQEQGWKQILPLLSDDEISYMFPIFQYMWEVTGWRR